ncbi:hypothetical protein QE372_002923 [Agrobacterium pusense]|uniref:hypothetical protein n=1 Tax=Agrobacterium pusense TaxID=648995 RepID=UPI00286362FF|nr:hypothetical protein [Agrobacterium pusense]MDR6190608.1 hypothetical protein [Agrobacterium pusense]
MEKLPFFIYGQAITDQTAEDNVGVGQRLPLRHLASAKINEGEQREEGVELINLDGSATLDNAVKLKMWVSMWVSAVNVSKAINKYWYFSVYGREGGSLYHVICKLLISI